MAHLLKSATKWQPKNHLQNLSKVGFIFIFASIGAYLLFHGFAASPPKQNPHKNDDVTTVELLNGQIEAMSRAVRADGNRKVNVAKALLSLSQQRQGLMENLIKSNPETASGLMLADPDLSNLGGISGNKLEKKTTLTGMYYVRDEDDKPDTNTLVVKGTEYGIYTNGALPYIPIEANVSMTGYQFGNMLFIPTYLKNPIKSQIKINSVPAKNHNVADGSELAKAIAKDPNNHVLAASQTVTNVAVIEVNFTCASCTTPVNDSIIRAAFNGSPGKDLDSFWQEASYGKEVLNPTFLPAYTVTSTSACPTGLNNTSPGDSLFLNQYGSTINWSQYQRYAMFFNCNSADGAVDMLLPGNSTILGSELYSQVFGGTAIGLGAATGHELSHVAGGNLHAQWYDCQPQTFRPPTRFGENCLAYDYDNPFDILGSVDNGTADVAGHLDALHKSHAGWFDPGNFPTITTSGTYKILPYETPTSGILALNIPRGNSGTAFTLEYRQPIGFDSWMTSSNSNCGPACAADKGPMLNFIYNAGIRTGGDTQLLDTTPLSNITGANGSLDVLDGTLTPGKTFTDPEYGVSFTTISADATGTTVQVTIPTSAACARNAPTVTPSSSLNQTVSPGQPATYTYTVKSNDSASCSPIKYKYSWPDAARNNTATNSSNVSLTNYFAHTVSPDVFTLAPGASTTVTVTVNPLNNQRNYVDNGGNVTTNGTWIDTHLGTISSDSLATSTVDLGSVNYIVTSAADSIAPTIPTNFTAQPQGGGAIKFSWTASTDNSGTVAGYLVSLDNGFIYQTTQTSLFLPVAEGQPFLTGSHTATVQAIDLSNHFSTAASSSFTMPTKTDTTAPTPPQIISTTATDHTVTVTWTASTDNIGIIAYKVYISGIGGSYIFPTANTPTYSFTFTGLPTNTSQHILIQAIDGDGNYSWYAGSAYLNNAVDITTANGGTSPPTAPTMAHISQATIAAAKLDWQPSTDDKGVAGYYIYRNGLRYATVTTNSFTDTSFGQGSFPAYAVEAFDADGNVSSQATFEYGFRLPQQLLNNTDTTPPTITLTSPTNGASIGSTLNLSATAQDNAGIQQVSFYIDGHNMGGASSAPYTLSWDMSQTYKGIHTIEAIVQDTGTNQTSTGVITITNNGPTSLLGDITGPIGTPDGHVDIYDLNMLLTNYGTNNVTCDINKTGTSNGIVDVFDLSTLLTTYGR